jgi:hypothetical protein
MANSFIVSSPDGGVEFLVTGRIGGLENTLRRLPPGSD